jgi:hypothetical protein
MLESAYGIHPNDKSETAQAARRIASFGDLDNLRFVAKIGIAKAQNGFEPKNVLAAVVTPASSFWHALDQLPRQMSNGAATHSPAAPVMNGAAQTTAPAVVRPAWAR